MCKIPSADNRINRDSPVDCLPFARCVGMEATALEVVAEVLGEHLQPSVTEVKVRHR